MRVIAINGSPRKNHNTATLLKQALRGAAESGADTKIYHLNDLSYSACKSCFACKSKKLPQTGLCALKDGLTPVIAEILAADVLIAGSPVYFYSESAPFRAFMERLLFPLNKYTTTDRAIFKKMKPVGLIYTMNITEEEVKKRKPPFPAPFSLDTVAKTEYFFARAFGYSETMLSTDTMQVEDYSAYYMEMYDADAKAKRHAEVFPKDCQNAFMMGKRLVEKTALSR